MSSARVAPTSPPDKGKELGKGAQESQVFGSEPDLMDDREGGEDAVLDAKVERIYR